MQRLGVPTGRQVRGGGGEDERLWDAGPHLVMRRDLPPCGGGLSIPGGTGTEQSLLRGSISDRGRTRTLSCRLRWCWGVDSPLLSDASSTASVLADFWMACGVGTPDAGSTPSSSFSVSSRRKPLPTE